MGAEGVGSPYGEPNNSIDLAFLSIYWGATALEIMDRIDES